MTQESNKAFNEELTALLKKYNVTLMPQMSITIKDLPPPVEVKKEEVAPSVTEETK